MADEGYTKFRVEWERRAIEYPLELDAINRSRSLLRRLGMIGAYPDGVGFGNVSVRVPNLANFPTSFVISGTTTGHLSRLEMQHLALVRSFDIEANLLSCQGLTQASSESLTHAACYVARPEVRAVVHVHHQELWQRLLEQPVSRGGTSVHTTPSTATYGTPEIALAVQNFVAQSQHSCGIIVMAGHEGGLIAFASSLELATECLTAESKS